MILFYFQNFSNLNIYFGDLEIRGNDSMKNTLYEKQFFNSDDLI